MNILEFQAKNLCKEYGIPVPRSILLPNLKAIEIATHNLSFPIILKAQVQSKNRARSGGICLVRDLDEANHVLPTMFNQKINGQFVKLILAEEMVEFSSSFTVIFEYDKHDFSINLEISQSFSSINDNNGQNHQNDDKINHTIDPFVGILDATIFDIAAFLDIKQDNFKIFGDNLKNIWNMFIEQDLKKIIIDPLVVIENGNVFALGVDVELDANAIFRHSDNLHEYFDSGQAADIKNQLKRLDCDYKPSGSNICVLARSKEMCAAIIDILISIGLDVPESISIEGEISAEKMEVILNKIEEQAKSDVIIIHSACDQIDNRSILEGIRLFLSKNKKTMHIILRMDGIEWKARELEEENRNFFYIESLNQFSSVIKKLPKEKQ